MSPVTDPIGDFLARIRNSQRARRASCSAPYSKVLHALADLLQREGYLGSVEVTGEAPRRIVEITFSPARGNLDLTRVSTPGRRTYAGKRDLTPVLRGLGIAIVSTSQGLMTDREARAKGIGGEVLCTVSE